MQFQPLPFSAGRTLALVFWGAFALWILPELVAGKKKRSTGSSTSRDQGSLNLIAMLWLIGIALGFAFSFLLPLAAISRLRSPLFFAGIGLMILGVALRWYSVSVLGKYFTFDVAIHRGHVLVEAGPYRYVRHPSYTGALLSILGFGLALGNWASIVAGLACLGLAYAYRIPVEETALAAALGETYRQYSHRTWRLVPFLY